VGTVSNLREQILGAKDRKLMKVETPEWPCGCVYVRTLTPRERMQAKHEGDKDVQHIIVRAVAAVTCDEHGSRIFTEEGDVEQLMDLNGAVIDRIFTAAHDLATKSAPDVKAIEGNSSGTPTVS
jgi:hypothetical protein